MLYHVPVRQDGLFFSLGAALLKQYVHILHSSELLHNALAGKQVWIAGALHDLRERLPFLCSQMADFSEGVTDTHLTCGPQDAEELKRVLERLIATPGHILFLADDSYGEGFNRICDMISGYLPVLTPVGVLLPALPGGRWHNGALRAPNASVARFLSGKKVALWGKTPECMDQILQMIDPVHDSLAIAGVIHDTVNDCTTTDTGYRARPLDTVEKLGCDALLITKHILDTVNDFTALPTHTLLVMPHDREANTFPKPRDEALLFYPPSSSIRPAYLQGFTFESPLVLRNGYFINSIEREDYENGFHKTAYQPQEFDNSIHIFGPSFVQGSSIHIELSYSSALQLLLNKNKDAIDKKYIVNNFGVGATSIHNAYLLLCDRPVRNGDIVLFHNHVYEDYVYKLIPAMHTACMIKNARFFVLDHADVSMLHSPHENDLQFLDAACFARQSLLSNSDDNIQEKKIFLERMAATGITVFDLSDCLDGAPQGIYVDQYHLTEVGDRRIAEHIYLNLHTHGISCLAEAYAYSILNNASFIRNIIWSDVENERWLKPLYRMRGAEDEISGSIVMNCNPFTLGHKHIITKALEQVDKLYIFVVQEDKSSFSFEERISMVRAGTEEFGSRVCVLPSGKLVLSSATFPDYFCKDSVTYEPDTRTDILIFCTTVAPALKIQVRFFGEEPFCKVTAAYHRQLSELLPIFKIRPVQIPRLAQGGEAISASAVRRLLQEGRLDLLEQLVPPTSMPYLIKKRASETGDTTTRREQ